MIPDIFVCIEKIPRNDRGKVDFKALEEMEVETGTEFAAPENDTERMICDAFCEVLGAARIGRNDDFFLLGGTSLSVSVLISKLATLGGIAASDASLGIKEKGFGIACALGIGLIGRTR